MENGMIEPSASEGAAATDFGWVRAIVCTDFHKYDCFLLFRMSELLNLQRFL